VDYSLQKEELALMAKVFKLHETRDETSSAKRKSTSSV